MPCGHVPECWPGAPAWAPDGKHLSFALRTPGAHARSVYTVAADGSGLTKLLDFSGTIDALKYGPDGRLAMLATENANKEVGATEAGAPISGDLNQATPEQRIAVLDHGALHFASPPDMFVYEYDWRPGEAGFVGTAAPGDGDDNWWSAKLCSFSAAQARPSGGMASEKQSFAEGPEIAVGPLGALRNLAASNWGLHTAADVQSIWWKSDGFDVQGWLLLPEQSGGKLPMVTTVHGGPAAAVVPFFSGPGLTSTLLEHGYAVFRPNPRGSYGQGERFTLATVRDFGHGDLRDILAGIDAAAKVAPIDTARLGITGGSYGGF